MISFLKKDVLLLIRDKKELAILLLMPFLLIAILGFALSGFLEQATPELDMTVIVVHEDDPIAGSERFKQEVAQLGLPAEATKQLHDAADQLMPQQLLTNLLTSEALSDVLKLTEMDQQAAETALKQDKANAIMTLPAKFTYDTLNKMLLEKGEGSSIDLQLSEVSSLRAGVFHDIMESFVQAVNFQTALGQTTGNRGGEGSAVEAPQMNGEMTTISQFEPVSSLQYYTFGMIVMFTLFVAISMSGAAFLEKRQFTYDRIILSGAHPLRYLSGKAVSCALLAFVQMMVLVGLSSLIFQTFSGQAGSFWGKLLFISAVLAMFIGAMCAMLTAINFRFESKTATDVSGNMVVMILAFFGGSFFPLSQMSDVFVSIGEWTPNGAALTSYMQVIQGAAADRWMMGVYRLIGMAVVLMLLGLWLFPKRRLR